MAEDQNNAYIDFGDENPWTEVKIKLAADDLDRAGDIAGMSVPYGFYIEDYRELENEVLEIAHIDLIDDELLAKDKNIGYIHIYLEPDMNPVEAVSFLTERFSAENIDFEIETLICKKEDWQNNWKKFFTPIKVGKKLLIRPIWEDDCEPEDRKVLNLEPGLAFGTGMHNTTRLCLEALEDYINGGKTVLDLGCGSGILSIASLLYGAQSAEGVDIDELAVKTAIENGKMNGFSEPQYKVHCGDMTKEVSGTFDIVVANIVADIIVLFCKNARRFMKPGAHFIVSGILDIREPDVLAAFAEYGFTVKERRSDENWLCFVLE